MAAVTETCAIEVLTQKITCLLILLFFGRLHLLYRGVVELVALILVLTDFWDDYVVKLGCEQIAFHFGELSEDADFSYNFSS